ncbi:glutathione S-transferase [Stigmatella aurantiaca]|uniref:Glutathione S-transferase n=1 Tax=Stigmatella aurantiaca TaxID=41 RepID=A0A1H7H8W3_STIAU|nr:glutathione S-transferase family protein [Stigmatella aurantiaca]SEK46714.1 glutathione S-transferase [Stigmatella aurantiaca]
MALKFYAHPFSSYCQKVLIALYENALPFEWRMVDNAEVMAELSALWPLKRFPLLVDGGHTVPESSIIIEHLQLHHPGPVRLIPEDPRAALEVRALDRFFDNYVSTPQGRIVFNQLRPEASRDPYGVSEARTQLEMAYGWLDGWMANREWASGQDFSMADCAAAPFLFYAHWTHPIDARFANVHAYRQRLLKRPSFARAVDEARPYRSFFPLGVPEQD